MRPAPLPIPSGRPVVVWGNCQAAPIAGLLTPTLATSGGAPADVPPVFEADEADLVRLRTILPEAAALVSQPIRDEYATPGCGTRQLAALLPPDARLVRFPVTFDTTASPYQVNAHGGDGLRVTAPLTDYHDLRMLVAAERGWSVEQTLDWWPAPSADVVRANADGSRRELERREHDLDVTTSDLLGPGAMFTISHPTNALLAATARRILTALGLTGTGDDGGDDGRDDAGDERAVEAPTREYLGERRAPVEAAVVEALGWPAETVRPRWVVTGRELDPAEVASAQLAFYAARPDVVADSRTRHAARRTALALAP